MPPVVSCPHTTHTGIGITEWSIRRRSTRCTCAHIHTRTLTQPLTPRTYREFTRSQSKVTNLHLLLALVRAPHTQRSIRFHTFVSVVFVFVYFSLALQCKCELVILFCSAAFVGLQLASRRQRLLQNKCISFSVSA